MNILLNIFLSAVISVAGAWGLYHYAPLSLLDGQQSKSGVYGSAITTIAGTDTLSSSRSVINTNFANLNTDVSNMNGSTTNSTLTSAANLATIGTIISGTWNGGIVGATWGGTGSSTLAQYNVLLGSSTNPIGIVQGLGSSGQFLTSNGVGLPPSWQTGAVDQTASYNFVGTAFRVKNLISSSTIIIDQGGSPITYVLPTSHGAATTTLTEDGSGTLSWSVPDWRLLASTTIGTAVSTTTLSWWGASTTQLMIRASFYPAANSGERTDINIQFNADAGTNYGWSCNTDGAAAVSAASQKVIRINGATDWSNENSYNSVILNVRNIPNIVKVGFVEALGINGANTPAVSNCGIAWNNTTQWIGSISFGGGGTNAIKAGTQIAVYGSAQ